MSRKVILSVAVDPELVKLLSELAESQNMSRSQLVQRVLQQAVEQERATVAILGHPVLGPMMTRLFGTPDFLKTLVEAMGQQLPAEQLPLFHKALQDATVQVPAAAALVKKKKRGRG